MRDEWFSQRAYRVRLDWGRRGARDAAARGDALVIVDVLRFSTTAVTAIARGGVLYPCLETEDVTTFTKRVGAEVGGRDAAYSLSPLSFLTLAPGTRVALASPNGATCARYAAQVPSLFVGALVNAEAVARAVTAVLDSSALAVTVIACGERWETPSEDGELRFAVEDYLGAGAILSYLPQAQASPEARCCVGAFAAVRDHLETTLLECGSGIELQAKGRADDVRHAARLNLYEAVPVMRGEALVKLML